MVKRRGVWHSRAPPPLSLGLVYDPAVSGTAVLTLSIISAAARGCSRVRPLFRVTFEVVRGVELYDTAVSGTAMSAPPLLTACTHCCVLVPSCWIRRYPLLFLVVVLSIRCCGVWHGSARSLAA